LEEDREDAAELGDPVRWLDHVTGRQHLGPRDRAGWGNERGAERRLGAVRGEGLLGREVGEVRAGDPGRTTDHELPASGAEVGGAEPDRHRAERKAVAGRAISRA